MARKKRNFAVEYKNYQGKPSQIAARSERNKARRIMVKKLGKAAVKGRDVDHKKGTAAGNGPKNLRLLTPHNNRSFSRNKDGSVKKRRP